MINLFCIWAAAWRISSGILPGICAVLRHFLDLSQSPSVNGGFCERSEFKGKHREEEKLRRRLYLPFLIATFTFLFASSAFSATIIDNTAKASYSVGSLPVVTSSNKVSMCVRTPAQLEFLLYAPEDAAAEMISVPSTGHSSSGSLEGPFTELDPPVRAPIFGGGGIDLSGDVPLLETTVYHVGSAMFLRLTDLDQNVDPEVREMVVVTIVSDGDREVLLFTEITPDSGVFMGYIQSSFSSVAPDNRFLSIDEGSSITATYTDQSDSTDISVDAALVDPFGILFDSSTGLPVDGATISLINADTGLPADVYGDDGTSVYDNPVTTGGTATDASGKVYSFTAGGYRFPLLNPGNYRLDVTPPAGYTAPSTVGTTTLQSLPGAPFAIAEPGSRGETFIVNPGPPVHIDIPIDPIVTNLFLRKTASKSLVAVGDFLQYRVEVENTTAALAANVLVADRLPLGFRYQKGSAKLDGTPMTEPTISSDGRSLTFAAGNVAANSSVAISYVVEVAVGARLGTATNSATASSGALTSNTARATVKVREDFLRSKTIIMGRVATDCDGSEGLPGLRIYLEDGTYVISDEKGMYHFEGVKPGTHVVQLDLETIPEDYELITCEENDRFAGRAFSQFVDIQGGTMWRADFYVAPKPEAPPVEIKGSVGMELSSLLKSPELEIQDRDGRGDPLAYQTVEYELSLHIGDVPLTNRRLSVILPEGLEYKKGSSSLGDETLTDPGVMENVLTYRLGGAKKGWKEKLRFSANVATNGKEGELVTKALLTFDSLAGKNFRTPLLENILQRKTEKERVSNPDMTIHPHFEVFSELLAEEDELVLDGIVEDLKQTSVSHIYVTGHTDSTRINSRSRHLFADNYELSKARAKSVGDYIALGLGLSPSQVTNEGKGPDEPVANNETAEGRTLNRRVELKVISEKVTQWSELKNIKERSGIKEIEISGTISAEMITEEKEAAEKEKNRGKKIQEFDSTWLDAAEPGLAFVWPYDSFNPPVPSIKIAIKHDPRKKLKLLLNGEEVDPLYLDGTKKRRDREVAVSLWIGVHLNDGDNLFEAVEWGSEENRISRTIHYSGPPVKVELVLEQSRLTVDGKTPSVIAVRLTDKDGHPAREGVVGEYSLDPPYMPLQKVEELQENPLVMSKSERLRYLVGEDGIAFIELQPTSNTGEATLRFNLVSGENEVRTWLTPGERDWIIVGLAEGTAGYNSVSGNMESFKGSGVEDNYYEDGRLAFFAKGMIKGKWLLTMAYDSAKDTGGDSLHQTIDPDTYYTLYGDTSVQQYDAASARKLYLKIERDKFYALFGDYNTGLTLTELSRYSRSFNGLKSEMKGEKFDFNVFVSDTNQAFKKDEIRGDGTSGLYFLSSSNIVANSETITIETRDRFRSEVIISSKTLSRHIDYNIDYENRTIFFKEPLYSKDEMFNPIYIVVDYESRNSSDESYNYGGRGAVRVLDNKLEVGATHVHEGAEGAEGDLFGLDAKYRITEKTDLKVEIATTDTASGGISNDGSAYVAEVTHRSDKMDMKVYQRRQEGEFGLGQQRGSENGTLKTGLDGSYKSSDTLTYSGQLYRQTNLSIGSDRDLAEMRANYRKDRYSLYGGLRHVTDEFSNGSSYYSDQINLGGSVRTWNDKLTLKVNHDQSISGNNESSDYPTRTTLGADYELSDSATLFTSHEITNGDKEDSDATRVGIKASPWKGGQLSTSLDQQRTENGTRLYSNLGLKQAWQINEKWSVDGGLDRTSTLRHPGNQSVNMNVPPASGSNNDFTAVSLGVSYREEKWSWSSRIENRNSDTEEKKGLFIGVNGEVRDGLGLSLGFSGFKTDNVTGVKKRNGNIRFGLAYRPERGKWIVLDRLDLLYNEQKGSSFNYDNWRIVNNLNANYKLDWKTQLSFQYGAKYVNESIDDKDYSGYTDLMGFEGRYDITKKWDIGLHASILHSWDAEQFDYRSGLSLGHSFVDNVWASLGYNFNGFSDRDFSRANFTSKGLYVKFRVKFDQQSAREMVRWIESR